MTKIRTTFDAMTTGSAPTATEGIAAIGGTGITVGATLPWHGTKCLAIDGPTAGAASTNIRLSGFSGATAIEIVAMMHYSTMPTTDLTIGYLRDSAAASTMTFVLRGSNYSTLPGAIEMYSNKDTSIRANSTAATAAGSYYRIGMYFEPGTSSTTGKYRFAIFLGDSLTALYDSGLVSGVNTAAAVGAFGDVGIGKADTNSYGGVLRFDSIQINTGADATQNFAPYSPAAAALVHPISVLSNAGGWTIVGGSVTQAQALSDSSNATYVTSAGSAASESDLLRLPTMSNLGTDKWGYTAWIPSGSTATKLVARLLCDTTEVATDTRTTTDATTPLTSTPQAYGPLTLSPAQSALITDRSKLRVELLGNVA